MFLKITPVVDPIIKISYNSEPASHEHLPLPSLVYLGFSGQAPRFSSLICAVFILKVSSLPIATPPPTSSLVLPFLLDPFVPLLKAPHRPQKLWHDHTHFAEEETEVWET